jgi:hypothetical protein
MEAYEIRLELLKMSKELLMEEWYCKRESIDKVYTQKRDIQMDLEYNKQVVEYPEIPSVPTSELIIELANSLNVFVSKRT